MAVTLLTLLKAAPMKEETRQKLLAGLATMSEAQKEELSATCWTVLSQLYFAKLKYEIEKYQLEVSQGKKEYKVADLAEIEKKLTQEYTQKFKSAEGEVDIETVRQELQKYQKPAAPPPTPPVAPTNQL